MSGDEQQLNKPSKFSIYDFGAVVSGLGILMFAMLGFVRIGGETSIEILKAIGGFGTLVAAGAVWFGLKYHRKQVENQSAQLKSEHEWRINEQFYKACTELGSASEHARIAALFTLQSLTMKNHIPLKQAVRVITALIRSRSTEISHDVPKFTEDYEKYRVPEDIATAVFSLRDLYRAYQSEWNDIGGNLDGANLSGLTIDGVDFSMWTFREATFINTYFVRCTFSNAYMERSGWYKSGVESCDFRFAQLQRAVLLEVELSNTDFRNANLTNSDWVNVKIVYQDDRVQQPFEAVGNPPQNLRTAIEAVEENLKTQKRSSITVN